jgi:hypothetical protein
MTHTCTSCGKILTYTNNGSYRNAKCVLKKTGIIRCQPCAGKEGQLSRKTKPTGRPKGVKNKDNSNIKSSISQYNKYGITEEVRKKGIATRMGYSSYEEYAKSLPDWKRYRNEVNRLTKKQPLHQLENYDKRAPNGKEGGYTLDHVISIVYGFKNNIPVEVISHISNLKMIPWKDNIVKGWKLNHIYTKRFT